MTRRRAEHFQISQLKRTYNKTTDTFTINISYETAPAQLTKRIKEVSEAFGLGCDQTRRFTLYENLNIHIRPTDVVLITGDSGSGKSALLKALKADLAQEAQDAKDTPISPDTPIVETIGQNTTEAIQTLSCVGLNDAFLFLRPYRELSDGQKHRYQTALLAASEKPFWILDEFTSTLDRDTAKILAFNLQRLARRMGKAVIAATTHMDLLRDFAPNVHIHKRYGKEVKVKYYPKAKAAACTLVRQMCLEQGTIADYKSLSQFHYRANRLPPPKKIFTLKRKGELCAAIVYSYPSPVMFGRRQVWKGTFKQLQQEVSVVSRVIVHPKYRSIGLGEKIVKETLSQAGTPCVEAVAVMAKYNPFFEKAGMTRVAESKPNPHVHCALAQLKTLGFDTELLSATGLTEQKILNVGKERVVEVLVELSKSDAIVRRRLANLKSVYPKHEEFTQKIGQLDAAGLSEVLKKLGFASQSKVYLFWTSKAKLYP